MDPELALHGGVRTPGVESPRRVLQMLLAFSEERPRATTRELAAAVGVPLSTAYRYVSLLRELGLLEEAEGGTYQVGPRIHAVSRASEQVNPLARRARPLMGELADRLGETTMLVRAIGAAAVCVARVESDRAVRLSVQPGQPLPLYTGASGKALLVAMPPGQRERLLADVAGLGPDERKRLAEEIEEVVSRGWAESEGEIDEGIWACSVALTPPGEPAAALTVAGPAYRIAGTQRAEVRDALLDVARRLGTSPGSRE